ncbi:MAG: DEAD/DEAH box helicase, partial [archaeon]
IQENAIPAALQGRDLVGQAKTGTGKTAAFALPILNAIDLDARKPQALIVVPTRELAQQVMEETFALGKHLGANCIAVYGGASLVMQSRELKSRPQIVVGTPGRIIDFLERRELDISELKFVVLDEADRMLEMGFREDMELILKHAPKERQTMLFSATMPQEIMDISERYLKDAMHFNLSEDTLTVEGVEQFYIAVNPKQKLDALLFLLKEEKITKGLVFCRTKRTADWLTMQLKKRRVNAMALHGDLRQNARDNALERFNQGKTQLLISTNLASRGLQIEEVSHVINFDFPTETETYVHRIGRTARRGNSGTAITFVTSIAEEDDLRRIESGAHTQIMELDTPFR